MAAVATSGVVVMTTEEARATVERIKTSLEDVRGLLFDLREREGWRVLGYSTWQECITSEFHMSRSYAHRLINAHVIDLILSEADEDGQMLPVGNIVPVPERIARELAPVIDDPNAVRKIVAKVVTEKGDAATAEDTRKEVDRHLSRPARPAPKPSAATKRVAEQDLSQDIPDDLALAGADVDPAHEFPFNNEPAVAPKAEQWCQTCGGKYRGAACPCSSTVEVAPTAAATAHVEEARPEPSVHRDDWRPVRSAISDPTPARRTGMDGGAVIYVDATAGAITRALFSHGGGVVAIVDAIVEEAPAEQFTAIVGLMSERPEVYEPWQPQAGMWVRVQRGPECRAHHSMHGQEEDGAYGRIEWIDREWDNPSAWREAYEHDGEPAATADEDARRESGHYYCVQDVLDTGRVAILDGFYCAAELVQVSEVEALAGIAEARLANSYLTPEDRLRRALLGAAGR